MKVLFATDGSAAAVRAGALLERLTVRSTVELTVLTVVEELKGVARHVLEHHAFRGALQLLEAEAEQLAAAAATSFARGGRVVRTEVRHGHPAQTIIDAADDLAAELVVVGSHGLTGGDFSLGSVSQKVAKYTPCSVLVFREPTADETVPHAQWSNETGVRRPLRVLVATDGSEAADYGTELVASLGIEERASIQLLTVVTPHVLLKGEPELEALWDGEIRAARAGLAAATGALAGGVWDVGEKLREGDPSSEIVSEAQASGADVIVVGHTGGSRVARFLLGGVTSRLIHHAPCSVLIARSR